MCLAQLLRQAVQPRRLQQGPAHPSWALRLRQGFMPQPWSFQVLFRVLKAHIESFGIKAPPMQNCIREVDA